MLVWIGHHHTTKMYSTPIVECAMRKENNKEKKPLTRFLTTPLCAFENHVRYIRFIREMRMGCSFLTAGCSFGGVVFVVVDSTNIYENFYT